MQAKIVNELRSIEHQFKVKIVYACESGSRAWGFPSQTSDYDVRFIYRHPPDWYLSIFEKRDVIEMPLGKILDINGWDFRKMLRLLHKGNTPLQEWLCSPIVYRTSDAVITAVTELAYKAFRPESACHHYLSMAKKKIMLIRSGKDAPVKAYLYALRPILCCRWIITNQTQPPMRIDDLLAKFPPCGEVRLAIGHLLEIRQKSTETDTVECGMQNVKYRIPNSDNVPNSDSLMQVLCEFLDSELQELSQRIPKNSPKTDLQAFDELFKTVVMNA